MRRWTYGVNHYYETSNIVVEEGKWVVFFLLYIVDSLCDFLHNKKSIPLLKIRFKPKYYDNEFRLLNEYYGGLETIFHIFIHMPITNFLYRYIKIDHIKVDYNELRNLFQERDKEFWDKSLLNREMFDEI